MFCKLTSTKSYFGKSFYGSNIITYVTLILFLINNMVFILKVSANFSQYQLFFLTFIEDYEFIYGRLLIAPRVGVLNLSIRLVWYNSIKDK